MKNQATAMDQYLGLSFEAHIKVCTKVKINFSLYFRQGVSTEAAKIFLYSIIFSLLDHWITSWSQASQSYKTFKSVVQTSH